LAKGFEDAISEETWEEAGQEILDAFEDAGYYMNDSILGGLGISSKSSKKTLQTLGEKDQWKCNYKRWKIETTR